MMDSSEETSNAVSAAAASADASTEKLISIFRVFRHQLVSLKIGVLAGMLQGFLLILAVEILAVMRGQDPTGEAVTAVVLIVDALLMTWFLAAWRRADRSIVDVEKQQDRRHEATQ
ncbi:MAG: hypothetical protein KGL39_39170 [Patescibacteria group bacterium]|nr:hypothetical protein [Patescibacteria group bacterium]